MNYSPFRMYMPDSPAGHEIVRIDGVASAVLERARSIVALGEQMEAAALTLSAIAEGQVGAGDSLQALKDQAEEVHADLAKAGVRYSDSGEVLVRYGHALAEAQRVLDPIVQQCIDQWEIVQSRASAADSADREVSDGDTTAADTAVDRLGAAEGEWETIAARYDAPFETWETAYEAAVSGLQDVNENGVSDGFWDDVLPAVELLVTILEWVGLALVIAALVIGGPILAVLAAVVAVLALVGTLLLYYKGRKEGIDVALAVIGVLPFGKLGQLGGAVSDAAAAGARFPRLTGALNVARGADDIAGARAIFTSLDGMAARAWAQNAPNALRPFNQLTAGSRFFQRVSVLPDFVRQNPVALDFSRDAFAGRFLGIAPGTGPVSLLEGQLARFGGMSNNVLSPLSTVIGAVEDVQTGRDIDSWRG